jgi:hypothetical protein
MNDDERMERFFAALAERAGTPPLGPDEAGEVLKLTKVVAHRTERRYAPLTSYVLGIALGASADSADPVARAGRVRALIDAVQQVAREMGDEPGEHAPDEVEDG